MLNVNLLMEHARAVPVRELVIRGVAELGRALASRTFMIIVAAPFVAWAIALMWLHAHAPDAVVRAVADGPYILLALWVVMVAVWFAIVGAFGAARHTVAVGLALAVIVAVMAQMTPPRATRGAPDRAVLPPPVPAVR